MISTGKEINRKIRQKTTTEDMCIRWEGRQEKSLGGDATEANLVDENTLALSKILEKHSQQS